MRNFALVRVLNVSECRLIEDERSGIEYEWYTLDVEGGSLFVKKQNPDIDIPVGWSGLAKIELSLKIGSFADKNGLEKRQSCFKCVTLLEFVKGFKHPDFSDIINSVKK